MRFPKAFVLCLILILLSQTAYPQSHIPYNEQQLFLSGANLAWIAFANDIGHGQTDFNTLADVMLRRPFDGG